MTKAKYVHRVSVPALIAFDLESDNEVPTLAEVNDAMSDYFDGVEIDRNKHLCIYAELSAPAEEYGVKAFFVDDTEEIE